VLTNVEKSVAIDSSKPVSSKKRKAKPQQGERALENVTNKIVRVGQEISEDRVMVKDEEGNTMYRYYRDLEKR